MRREGVVECVFGEAFVRVILACHSLVGPLPQRLLVEVPLSSRCYSSESHVRRRIVAELSLNFAHVLDLVWVGIGAGTNWLVMLDSKVDALD